MLLNLHVVQQDPGVRFLICITSHHHCQVPLEGEKLGPLPLCGTQGLHQLGSSERLMRFSE